MNFFVIAFALLASASYADEYKNVDIDWSTVKPIAYYPKFWDNKPPQMRPSPSFFANYNKSQERQNIRNPGPAGRVVGGRPAQ